MKHEARALRALTLAFLSSTVALLQCGSTSSTSGTETHWLQSCESDAECGGFQCVCGLCTLPCTDTADCNEAPETSVCGSTSAALDPEACASDVVGFCTTPDQVSGAGGTEGSGAGGSGGSRVSGD